MKLKSVRNNFIKVYDSSNKKRVSYFLFVRKIDTSDAPAMIYLDCFGVSRTMSGSSVIENNRTSLSYAYFQKCSEIDYGHEVVIELLNRIFE
jgi:hypothetical protein